MSKISLKKETKSMKLNLKSKTKAKPKAKPKAKAKPKTKVEIPKQAQTQGVVVNIGTNVSKPIRRRKSSAIEKKVANKQPAPSTVYVPQAMPVIQSKQQPVSNATPLIQQQPSMNEFINYLKQAEQHKEAIKEREKNVNDLEKDKKEEKRSEVLTKDEVQDNFSGVFPSSNISPLLPSLSGGYTTPIFFKSKEHIDYDQVFRKLAKEADLRGENPNSGRITFAQAFDNPTLLPTPTTTSVISNPIKKQSLTDLLSNVEGEIVGDVTTRYQPIIPTEFKEVKPQIVKEVKPPTIIEEDILDEDVFHDLPDEEEELEQLEEEEQNPIPNEDIVVANEDPVIDEALKQKPENQIVLYEQRKVTLQKNAIDGTIPGYLRPMNNALPSVYLKDILERKEPLSFAEKLKEKRKEKPLLAIEPQTVQGEAEDTIKLLEELLNPKKKVSTPDFTKEDFEKYKTYTKEVGEAEKAAEKEGITSNFEEEDKKEEKILTSREKFIEKITNPKFTRKDMVMLLNSNGITEKDGLKYRIYTNNVNLGTKSADRTRLTEHLLQEYNDGRITNY
jgi:hypothetical protein